MGIATNLESRSQLAIELSGVCKAFGHVQANSDVDLAVPEGTIHGIVGENGAGKSTLMSILYGFYTADRGKINIKGKQVDIPDSAAAIKLGIGMVHQHFMLVPVFSVLENVMLGVEGGPILASGKLKARAELKRLASEYELAVDPDALIQDLPVGLRQRVEILKALYRGARILILDEPTGVLTPQEATRLFEILRLMCKRGETIILITHKLREIMAVTDNVTVMRGGKVVANRETAKTSPEELAELMVGRKVLLSVDKKPNQPGDVKLAVNELGVMSNAGVLGVKHASFEVRAGEILGVAGVSGNGQSELLQALAGMQPIVAGQITVHGEPITADTPTDPVKLRKLGVAHVPEDRHECGLVMDFPAEDSLILGHHYYDQFVRNHLLMRDKIHNFAELVMDNFDVRPNAPLLRSADFSGGNQQKIVLAREIDEQPEVLLIGQPTRGVDIGAIEAIHRRLIAMRDQGCAIVLVSFELDEIMSLSDRIIVMNAGRIVGEVVTAETNENELGLLMAGVG